MTTKEIFVKTMKFTWLKLALGGITIVAMAILVAIFLGIGSLLGEAGFAVGLVLSVISIGVARMLILIYFGYLIKAGHIAIIMQASTTGHIPENQFEVAKQMVTERFATSTIYFGIDRLISGTVKQLQGIVSKVGDLLGKVIPGMDFITAILNAFINISLGYIDECCLAYTFYQREQNAFKSAADGVVIYYQNWKVLLKNAAMTALMVVGFTLFFTIVMFLLLAGIFKLFDGSLFIAFIIAFVIALALKNAFLDSFILIRTMVAYMQVAPTTVITHDLYGKLCGISSKFKSLFNKSTETQQAQTY